MKTRIVIALIVSALILVGLGFIPNNPSTAYPVPFPTPYNTDPIDNFRVSAVNCEEGFLLWSVRPAHVNPDDLYVHAVTWDWQVLSHAEHYATVGYDEYYRADFDPDIMYDRTWVVEGWWMVEGSVPLATTENHMEIDCTGLIKYRTRIPFTIFKKTW